MAAPVFSFFFFLSVFSWYPFSFLLRFWPSPSSSFAEPLRHHLPLHFAAVNFLSLCVTLLCSFLHLGCARLSFSRYISHLRAQPSSSASSGRPQARPGPSSREQQLFLASLCARFSLVQNRSLAASDGCHLQVLSLVSSKHRTRPSSTL